MKAYTDGACRLSNPGLCSCSFVLYTLGCETFALNKYLGPELHTNNYAEYQGLLLCLRTLYEKQISDVDIYCDSFLVVNQTLGRWQINNRDLAPFAAEAFGLLIKGGHRLHHIKGHSGDKGNERADELCNVCLDAHMEEYFANLNKQIVG